MKREKKGSEGGAERADGAERRGEERKWEERKSAEPPSAPPYYSLYCIYTDTDYLRATPYI